MRGGVRQEGAGPGGCGGDDLCPILTEDETVWIYVFLYLLGANFESEDAAGR